MTPNEKSPHLSPPQQRTTKRKVLVRSGNHREGGKGRTHCDGSSTVIATAQEGIKLMGESPTKDRMREAAYIVSVGAVVHVVCHAVEDGDSAADVVHL